MELTLHFAASVSIAGTSLLGAQYRHCGGKTFARTQIGKKLIAWSDGTFGCRNSFWAAYRADFARDFDDTLERRSRYLNKPPFFFHGTGAA